MTTPTRAGRRSSNITGKGWALALAAIGLLACTPEPASAPEVVDPADYDAFYLWTGVEPHPAMESAEAVYLLWGELRRGDPESIVPLRRTIPAVDTGELWLVVRAERLDWSDDAIAQLQAAARQWDRDDRLKGIQVDFDSSTGGLGDYARFLANIRAQLPDKWQLSATGLMDWPANASDEDLAAMAASLDEIVVQTYRHTTTQADYRRYLAATERLDLPYRVALVEGGEWDAPGHLARDPNFKGYVVFLLGERFRQKS